jgi:hypothetical protein
MKEWRFRLKPPKDFPDTKQVSSRKEETAGKIARFAGTSYPPINDFMYGPGGVLRLDLKTFATYLIEGLGYSVDEVKRMKIEDLFEVEEIDGRK